MEKKSKDYNPKAPGVRRILREAFELRDSTYQYYAQPLEENIYEWHFTIRGPDETEFQGGFYHGRILLPNEYPMKPPNFIFLTPNGRFDVNCKICLNISGFHPESWQPCWSIRTVLLAIISFLPVPYDGSVGSINYPADERKKLAKQSRKFTCDTCNCSNISDLLKSQPVNDEAHNSQWYKDFQVYIQNFTAEHSNQSKNITKIDNDSEPILNRPSFCENLPNNQSEETAKTSLPISLQPSSSLSSSNELPNNAEQTVVTKTTATDTMTATNTTITTDTKQTDKNDNQNTITVSQNEIYFNSFVHTLRGPTGEIILWLCFGLTLAIIVRRFILNFYGSDD